MITSYEQQLAIVRDLPLPAADSERHIEWCVSDGVIGLARTPNGLIEIFLEGPRLEARYRRVRDAIEHERWFRVGGDELLANRILLPAAGHFEQVAAFLCTELLRNNVTDDLVGAFAATEPLIELAIEDLLVADETLLGLCGELLLLRSLIVTAVGDCVGEILESWKGHRETARDFQLGSVGVEVKTTTRSTSSHLFSGIHQLEVGHGVDGTEETDFMVASVGLEWTDNNENSTNLPKLVDALVDSITAASGASADAFVDQLLTKIADYGSPNVLGYDHKTMKSRARFSRRFRPSFARGYDMTDPLIRLLTTDDMRARPFIDVDSLHLRVNLPAEVNGDVNPVVGLANCARAILRASRLGAEDQRFSVDDQDAPEPGSRPKDASGRI